MTHWWTGQKGSFRMTPRVTLESLAGMVKEGFKGIAGDIAGLKSDIERIDLRLSQAAYRFELGGLERRVEILERQSSIPRASSS